MKLARVVALIGLTSGAIGCTIEHTKPLNAECLQDRECVMGLECQSRPDGRYACTMPGGVLPPEDSAVRVDVASEVTSPEAGSVDAVSEASTPDVPMSTDTSSSVDAPRD